MVDTSLRAELIARGAAQWRDPQSRVRERARAALHDSAWSAQVIESALDDVLFDLDEERARMLAVESANVDARPILVVLPGNIIGPTIASAFCAATAGANIILKSPGDERMLAPILAEQFESLGRPLAGTIDARYWKGGDPEIEPAVFAAVRKIIAFGSDEAIDAIGPRAPVPVRGFGISYSIGFVTKSADTTQAASGAARDIAMFDQRGCMSPQTIYVEGDEARALLFAHALDAELRRASDTLPRARISRDEAAAVAMAIRKLSVSALAPKTHGLDTLMRGPEIDGVPGYTVVVEPTGPPTIEGFGRIVSVKPCESMETLLRIERAASIRLESLGYAGDVPSELLAQLMQSGFVRVCPLGEMQRPPFGYRPTVEDFA
ncbi:MAG TPA: acyl-CoA reductase [Candidatus Eremiobacteraceae bacterium]|nr:acyl-CoA reductase [Candidatus Eremiobacteraceae bacterium]